MMKSSRESTIEASASSAIHRVAIGPAVNVVETQRSNVRASSQLGRLCIAIMCGLSLLTASHAQEPEHELKIRHLYVPVEALKDIANKDRFAAILSRKEFDILVEQANVRVQKSDTQPQQPVLSEGNYLAKIDGERLIAEATIRITTFDESWNTVGVHIQGWNVEHATLNELPAIAQRHENEELRVLIEGAGRHELKLMMSLPLNAVGSDKVAMFTLSNAPSGQFNITLPAQKHLTVNGQTLSRSAEIDQPAEYSLPIGGKPQFEIKITDRHESTRSDVLTFANTAYGIQVQPSEITWVANAELQVFGKSIDQLKCLIPTSLEITGVDSTGLESWELSNKMDNPDQTEISLQYRQSFTGSRTITFRGILSSTPEKPWGVPNLKLPEITSHVGVLLVQHPDNLRLQAIDPVGVRAITAEEAKLLAVGSANLQYQIWEEDFLLQFVVDLKEQQVQAAMTNVLDITSQGLDLYTTLNLQSRLTPLFDARLRFPADWQIAEVVGSGPPLLWEVLPSEAGVNELRITLDPPLNPGENRGMTIIARAQPEAWPVEAEAVRISIPDIRLPQAAMVEALYGIAADDDLSVVGVDITGLDPARQTDVNLLNTKLQNLGKTVEFGYTYQDSVFSGQLEVTRKPATISAETLTFFRLDKETVFTRLEATLNVTGGGMREILVEISESVGENLRFTLIPWGQANLPVKIVEQAASDPQDGKRSWTLKLDQYIKGTYLLATESQVPRVPAEQYSPVQLTIPASDMNSGYIAIEGSPEEHVKFTAKSVDGTSLPVVDPVDFPQGQYRPQQRMVAGFRYVHPGWQLMVSNEQFDRGAVPSAIGHSLLLSSVIGEAGQFQHESALQFTAYGAQSLIVGLPQDAVLWSTLIDGQPVEVRQLSSGVSVPLNTAQADQVHSLKLLYSTPAPELTNVGELKITPPIVSVLDGTGEEQPLEVLKQSWNLHYPEETLLVSSPGLFQPTNTLTNNSFLSRLFGDVKLPSTGALWNRFVVLIISAGGLLLLARFVRQFSGRKLNVKRIATVVAVLLVFGFLIALLLPTIGSSRRSRVDVSFANTASEIPRDRYDDSDAVRGHQFDIDGDEFYGEAGGMGGIGNMELHDAPAAAPAPAVDFVVPQEPALNDPFQQSRVDEKPQDDFSKKRSESEQELKGVDAYSQNVPADAEEQNRRDGMNEWRSFSRSLAEQNKAPSIDGIQPTQPMSTPLSRSRVSGEKEGEVERLLRAEEMKQNQQRGLNGDAMPQLDLTREKDNLALGLNNGRYGMGGLLSMTFNMQVPENTRSETFHYQGNGTPEDQVDLHVKFASRTAGNVLLIAIALGIALLGWWLRTASLSNKLFLVFATIIVPLALAGIAPPLWHVILEGTLFGGILMLFCWCFRALVDGCKCCCTLVWKKCQMPPLAMLMFGVFLTFNSPLFAQKTTQAPMQQAELQRQVAPADQQVLPPPPKVEIDPYVVMPYPDSDRVWVPHDVYQKLWESRFQDQQRSQNAPIAALISEATYLAKIVTIGDEQQIAVQARWVVHNLNDATTAVVLPIQKAALNNVSINGEPVPLSNDPTGSYSVVVTGKGTHIVDATISLPSEGQLNAGQFEAILLPTSAGLFSFELPEHQEELQVRVNGSTGVYRRVSVDDRKVIEIPIDQGGTLTVAWRPKQQQGAQDNLVMLESTIAAVFDDIGMHLNSSYITRVRQGAINDLSFLLPPGVSIRQIVGEDVGGWEIDNENQTLRVFFRRQIESETRFQIDLYHKAEKDQTTVEFSSLIPQNVARETGQLALFATNHLVLRPGKLENLTQIDLAQFSPQHTLTKPETAPLFAYRYTITPVKLQATISRKESKANAQVQHGVYISQRKILIASLFNITLTGSPQQTLELRLPEDFLVIDVQCEHASDWYVTMDEEDGQTLTLELDQPRLGTIQLSLESHHVKEPDLASVDLFLPELFVVTSHATTVAIWLDDAYEAVINRMRGWQSVPVNQLPGQLNQLQSRPAQFGLRNVDELPDSIELALSRATPELNSDAVTLIAVSDSTIDYGLTLRWNISQAATDLLTFTTPQWLGQLNITGPGIRQVTSVDDGDLRRWSVSLVDPVKAQYLLTAAATVPAPLDLRVNTPVITVENVEENGAITPLDTQRQYTILVNLSSNQLVPVDLEQFESVSVDQLPLKVNEALVRQAMEITRIRDDKVPQWKLQRMETMSAAQAVVLAVNMETVLELDGSWRTKVNYAIRNRGRQFLALELPEKSHVLSVFVRGEPSRTVHTKLNEKTVHLIALPQTSEVDLSFDVNLLLAGRLSNRLLQQARINAQTVSMPAPQVVSQKDSADFGLPVAQTLWTVHAPDDLDIAPVGDVRKTNLTLHGGHDSFAAELQSLERYKSDISEMKRMVRDKKSSLATRQKAQQNLKQLEQVLEQQVQEVEEINGTVRGGEKMNQWYDSNRFLYRELQEDLSGIELSDETVPPQSPQLGRDFIANINNDLFISNSGAGVSPENDQTQQSIDSLNFRSIVTQPQAKSKAEGKDAQDRGVLKSQLANQAQITQGNADRYGNSLDGVQIESESKLGEGFSSGRFLGGQAPSGGRGTVPSLQVQPIQMPYGAPAGLKSHTIRGTTAFSTLSADKQDLVVDSREENWDTVGGLSVKMDIPVSGQELAFSKVGGNPILTLAMRPKQTWTLSLGALWCIACLIAGAVILSRMANRFSYSNLFDSISLVAVMIGIAGFVLLPADLRWTFFSMFCFGGLIKVALAGIRPNQSC